MIVSLVKKEKVAFEATIFLFEVAIMQIQRRCLMKYTDSFKAGDIIVCERFFYKHYGIYVGKDRVIHYATKNGDFGADVRIRETSFENFAGDGKCTLLSPIENSGGTNQFYPAETVSEKAWFDVREK
jgi:hypothetical protein